MEKIIGGIKRDCYPLTPAQMIQFNTLNYSDSAEIVNIGTGQYLKFDVDLAALREALNRAVERCDSMRLRIWKDPETGEIWQYVMPYEYQFFEYYDFSNWKQEKVDEVLRKWTSQPFDTFSGPLSRILILTLPGGFNGYYYNVHHCCMDSGSVIAFSKDVIDIYCYLMLDMPYPKPMTSYIESLKKDHEYEGSKMQKRDEEYWNEKFLKTEPMYTDFIGPERLERSRKENNNPKQRWCQLSSAAGDGNTITYRLDVDSTKKIIDFAAQYEVPVSAVLLHTIRTMLSKFNNNEEDISIRNFVSRRSSSFKRRCGGSRMHHFPLRTIIPVDTKVIDSIKIIAAEQQHLFRHSNYSSVQFIKNMNKKFNVAPGGKYESVGFTYQPETRKDLMPALKGIETNSVWYSSGKQAQAMYITAMHRPSDGGLNFYFGYQTDFADEEKINNLYYFMGRILFRSIENPEKTIKDIIDMT